MFKKSPAMLALEGRYGRDIKDILTSMYQRHGSYAAMELGISQGSLYRWLRELGLRPSRKHTVEPITDTNERREDA